MTVDELAQEIRRVDGDNSLGAGALAEALMPFLTRTPAPEGEVWRAVPVEPTEAMLDEADAPFHAALQQQREANRRAGRPLDAYGSGPVTKAVYHAMLAASPVVPVGREEIARIIDPWAFSVVGNIMHTERASEDRAKADAILAALGTKATDTGRE
jgi:hypothetical protein